MPSRMTQAAEGFPRRAFTVDEIRRMQDAGIIGEEENFEFVEGEIVPMGPKYAAHERIKSMVAMAMARACPAHSIVGFETSLFMSPTTFVEPDICLHARDIPSDEVRGPDVLLAVEVAASSLAFDLGAKAAIYAKHGVRELWVIDANLLVTHVHRDPVEGRWSRIGVQAADQLLSHPSAPGFAVRLAEL
jgi:Uma2 family endonuclease